MIVLEDQAVIAIFKVTGNILLDLIGDIDRDK